MAELFPYERFREGQRESIEAIYRKFRENFKTVIFKAPTGFGKTSVAIASMLTDPPVIHSVRTRNEVQPVLRDLRKLYSRRRGFSYSFIYSAHRMCPLLRERNMDPEDFWLSCQLLRSMGRCEFYNNAKKISSEEVFFIVSQEDYPEKIISRIVRELGACPFFSLAKLAEESSYLVATYPYAMDPELFHIILETRDPSEYSLVIDEAHMLTIPSRVFAEDFSVRDIDKAVEEIRRYLGEKEFVISILKKIQDTAIKKAVSNQLKYISRLEISLDPQIIDIIIQSAMEIKRKVFMELIESRGIEYAVSKRVHTVKIASALSLLNDPRFEMFVFRESEDKILIQISAVDHSVVGDALSRYRRILMMSGTPPTKEFVEELIGLDRVDQVNANEYITWRPQDNMAIIIATELSSRYTYRGELMYRLYSRYIEAFKKLSGLKIIVYPSYDFMSNILTYLPSLEKDFVENQKTTFEEVSEYVLRNPNTSLHIVAGGKISEGIEFVRDGVSLIKGVFVAGVPYPQPDDYMNILVERGSKKISREIFRELLFNNEAYIRTMQAIGRSVRSINDRAVVVLGDRRFMSSKLRGLLGLERFGVARNIDQFNSLLNKLLEEFL
jgi:DNA excision repair protein ERCC-2